MKHNITGENLFSKIIYIIQLKNDNYKQILDKWDNSEKCKLSDFWETLKNHTNPSFLNTLKICFGKPRDSISR